MPRVSDFVLLPAILFLPWAVSLAAIARWQRRAQPGDPMPWTARAGIVGILLCCVVVTIFAIRMLGPAEWFLVMILAWGTLTWITLKTRIFA